jgi:hypothetical protein
MTENSQYIEVTIGSATYRKRVEMQSWAKETFGDRVDCRGDIPVIYFESMEDVNFFMLRWS